MATAVAVAAAPPSAAGPSAWEWSIILRSVISADLERQAGFVTPPVESMLSFEYSRPSPSPPAVHPSIASAAVGVDTTSELVVVDDSEARSVFAVRRRTRRQSECVKTQPRCFGRQSPEQPLTLSLDFRPDAATPPGGHFCCRSAFEADAPLLSRIERTTRLASVRDSIRRRNPSGLLAVSGTPLPRGWLQLYSRASGLIPGPELAPWRGGAPSVVPSIRRKACPAEKAAEKMLFIRERRIH